MPTVSPDYCVQAIPNYWVYVIDLPKTALGNQHVLVFQDLFSKWPMVFAIPGQKTKRTVHILVDEIVPFCGVPEALLSDRVHDGHL